MIKEIYKCFGINEALQCLSHLERVYPKLRWKSNELLVSTFHEIILNCEIPHDDEIVLCIKQSNLLKKSFVFFRSKKCHGQSYFSDICHVNNLRKTHIFNAKDILPINTISKDDLLYFLKE